MRQECRFKIERETKRNSQAKPGLCFAWDLLLTLRVQQCETDRLRMCLVIAAGSVNLQVARADIYRCDNGRMCRVGADQQQARARVAIGHV